MFDFDDPKNWSALVIGILLTALGLIPLLGGFGIGPGFPEGVVGVISSIAAYILAGAGIYLLIDSFMEDDTMRLISLLVAVIIIGVGLIQILNSFGILGFAIPFFGPIVYNALFVVEGVFLVIAAFAMF